MKPSSAKAKGRKFQQMVASKIGELLNLPVGPDEMIASREMGQSGTDVRLIGTAKELFPFSVECKCQESWGVHKWIEQAIANQEKDTYWLLFCKRNRKRPVVIMDMSVFFAIMENLLITQEK